MQSLWSLKIDWIELPSEESQRVASFLRDFNSVRSICIGRCIVDPQATRRVELHGFADASEKCYGAVMILPFSIARWCNNSEACNK
ncbi:hypothetical protein TNCV_3847001 [Trichonephila clavipes]|nr:hypothetical protein TNCV_3847001 [Trichonephila clavipes]